LGPSRDRRKRAMFPSSRPFVLLLALLLLVGVTSVAPAAEVSGRVMEMALFYDWVVVRDDEGRIYFFNVVPNTNARLNDSQVQLFNLRPGDRVWTLYDTNFDGALLLKEIWATRP